MKRFKRIGWIVGYLVAAALLMLFVRRIDFTPLRSFTVAFWVRAVCGVFAFQLFIVALHSLQWGLLLANAGIGVSFRRLYGTRLAGAAVSILSPSLSIGGELVRVALLKTPAVSTSRLTATVAIDKYVELATRMPFVAAGLWVLVGRLPARNHLFLEAGMAFTLVVLTGSAFLITLLVRTDRRGHGGEQKTGFLSRIVDHIRPGIMRGLRQRLDEFAGSVAETRPSVLLPILAVGLLAAATELVQILFALHLLGLRGAGGAALVQSASTLGGIIGFLPANIGGMEATNVLSIGLLGGSAATALAYSLIVRGGQTGTALCGLIYLSARRLSALRRRPGEAAAPQRQCCSSE